jgi:hypothetical protein
MINNNHDSTRDHLRKRRPRAKQLLVSLCKTDRIPSSEVKHLQVNNSNKDDLLDTRLYHLLQDAQPYVPSIPSPPTSTSASNVLDTSWLDETSSILNLFPEVPPTSLPSPQGYFSDSNSPSSKHSCYNTASVDSLYSPVSFISPTQSPDLSPDSNHYPVMAPMNNTSNYTLNDYGAEYFKLSGQYDYHHPLAPPLTMDMYMFMSDSTNIPPSTH